MGVNGCKWAQMGAMWYPVNDMTLSLSGKGYDMCGFDVLCKGTNRYMYIITTIL